MSLAISSAAFAPAERIPPRHTADGENASPPLSWSGVPAGTAELALICDDPDAPRADPWIHWVVYRIAPAVAGLPEGLPARPQLSEPMGARQGQNDFRRVGYGGPAPPKGHGTHHYRFRLYALATKLDLEPGATAAALRNAMSGRILAEGELVGTYSR